MHPLLHRQLRRAGLTADELPSDLSAWQALLERIDESYQDIERERYLMERSLEISSREMQQLYQELKSASETAIAVERDRLQEVNLFLDSIVENLPDMLFVKDADELRFVRFNRAGEQLLGLSSDALLGRSDFDFFPREQAEFFVGKDRQVLASGQILEIPDEPIDTPEGTRRLHTKKIPILDDAGVPRYLLGISRDVTELKRAERELRESKAALVERNEELVELHRFKAEMSSLIVHDLKNPLAAVLGSLDHAIEFCPEADPEVVEALHDARHCSYRVLELLRNLADLQRIESGQLQLRREQVDVSRLLDDVIGPRGWEARSRGISLTCDIATGTPWLSADSRLLPRVIENLVDNAIRHTGSGGRIALAARARDGKFRIEVGNTGEPIPVDVRTRMFEKHATNAGSHSALNLGLGLYFCRIAVEAHGGHIWIEQRTDLPTVFCIELAADALALTA